jgi:hypothetical protein
VVVVEVVVEAVEEEMAAAAAWWEEGAAAAAEPAAGTAGGWLAAAPPWGLEDSRRRGETAARSLARCRKKGSIGPRVRVWAHCCKGVRCESESQERVRTGSEPHPQKNAPHHV